MMLKTIASGEGIEMNSILLISEGDPVFPVIVSSLIDTLLDNYEL